MVFGDLHLGGGFSIGEVTHPTLSAIRRPFDSIGEQAVRLLNQRISDQYKGPSWRSILPIELIVRESTV